MLVDEGLVGSLPDLYDLTAEDLVDLERFAETSATNLVGEIEDSRSPELASFLYALGIRHVGRDTARRLAEAFTLEDLMSASAEEIETVESIGPVVAGSVRSFFAGEGGRTVRELLDRGVAPRRAERGDALEGLTIVVTGSVEGYTRSELTELLESNGARVTSSVSGSTDLLVVGEGPGQTKLDDAEEHGVETVDVEAFRERVLSRIGAT